MNLNATLLGQMITFGIFVWFTMKYVWPPITQALEERKNKIAAGLAAAEKGEQALENAQVTVQAQMTEAKAQAADIIAKANHQQNMLVDEAKTKAQAEAARVGEKAQADILQEVNAAKRELQDKVASLAILSAEKILDANIDAAKQRELIDKVITEL
ncbi:MAG: ATP synthase subunit b [marine bacterium B5-7]|nr:MAG: ATP synthase subunit b [marine bacterium B5-7]